MLSTTYTKGISWSIFSISFCLCFPVSYLIWKRRHLYPLNAIPLSLVLLSHCGAPFGIYAFLGIYLEAFPDCWTEKIGSVTGYFPTATSVGVELFYIYVTYRLQVEKERAAQEENTRKLSQGCNKKSRNLTLPMTEDKTKCNGRNLGRETEAESGLKRKSCVDKQCRRAKSAFSCCPSYPSSSIGFTISFKPDSKFVSPLYLHMYHMLLFFVFCVPNLLVPWLLMEEDSLTRECVLQPTPDKQLEATILQFLPKVGYILYCIYMTMLLKRVEEAFSFKNSVWMTARFAMYICLPCTIAEAAVGTLYSQSSGIYLHVSLVSRTSWSCAYIFHIYASGILPLQISYREESRRMKIASEVGPPAEPSTTTKSLIKRSVPQASAKLESRSESSAATDSSIEDTQRSTILWYSKDSEEDHDDLPRKDDRKFVTQGGLVGKHKISLVPSMAAIISFPPTNGDKIQERQPPQLDIPRNVGTEPHKFSSAPALTMSTITTPSSASSFISPTFNVPHSTCHQNLLSSFVSSIQDLRALLYTDDRLLEEFQRYTVKEFCVENMLFIRDTRKLTKELQTLAPLLSPRTSILSRKTARKSRSKQAAQTLPQEVVQIPPQLRAPDAVTPFITPSGVDNLADTAALDCNRASFQLHQIAVLGLHIPSMAEHRSVAPITDPGSTPGSTPSCALPNCTVLPTPLLDTASPAVLTVYPGFNTEMRKEQVVKEVANTPVQSSGVKQQSQQTQSSELRMGQLLQGVKSTSLRAHSYGSRRGDSLPSIPNVDQKDDNNATSVLTLDKNSERSLSLMTTRSAKEGMQGSRRKRRRQEEEVLRRLEKQRIFNLMVLLSKTYLEASPRKSKSVTGRQGPGRASEEVLVLECLDVKLSEEVKEKLFLAIAVSMTRDCPDFICQALEEAENEVLGMLLDPFNRFLRLRLLDNKPEINESRKKVQGDPRGSQNEIGASSTFESKVANSSLKRSNSTLAHTKSAPGSSRSLLFTTKSKNSAVAPDDSEEL